MYDYHTHSNFSDDCGTSMEEMMDGAFQKGIREIAVTDHFDPDYPDPAFPFEVDFHAYHQKLEEMQRAWEGRLKILAGLEIGIQHGKTLEKCKAAVSAYPYDFIIGSFHCAWGQDLYGPYFKERSAEEGIGQFYEYMRFCLAEFTDFDVLGHFNVVDRYVPEVPAYEPYRDTVSDVLKLLIQKGKGIEFNTSSFRYGMRDRTTPAREILTLYKSLGGEIVTIGSDAHTPEHLAFGYASAKEILSQCGFRYLALFDDRVPRFVKISES